MRNSCLSVGKKECGIGVRASKSLLDYWFGIGSSVRGKFGTLLPLFLLLALSVSGNVTEFISLSSGRVSGGRPTILTDERDWLAH